MTLRSYIGLFALAAPLCMAQGAQSKPTVHPCPVGPGEGGITRAGKELTTDIARTQPQIDRLDTAKVVILLWSY